MSGSRSSVCAMKGGESVRYVDGRRKLGPSTWKKRRRVEDTNISPHMDAGTRARAHAPHYTLNQSATDKKIMPLSLLECSPLYPLNYRRPSPTHAKHCLSPFPSLLSRLRCGLGLGCPDLPRLWLYKCGPILSRVPKAAHWPHRPGLSNSRPNVAQPAGRPRMHVS